MSTYTGALSPCYRRESAKRTNLKKGSLAVVWANFIISKTNLPFCIFCLLPCFLSFTIPSATIKLQFRDRNNYDNCLEEDFLLAKINLDYIMLSIS